MMKSVSLFAAIVFVSACGGEDVSPTKQAPLPKAPEKVLTAPNPVPVIEAPKPEPVVIEETPVSKPKMPKPDSAGAALAAAKDLASAGDQDGAIEVLAAAAATFPRDAELRVELARLELAVGHVGSARKHAERATELKEDWSTAWNTLGRAELAAGELDDAIASFQHAVEANDENIYAWNNLGYALMRNKQWGDAVTALEHAVDADKVEPYMWNNLGMAYEHLDRLDDAREAYEEGAAAGSGPAKENRERLEGVESVAAAELE